MLLREEVVHLDTARRDNDQLLCAAVVAPCPAELYADAVIAYGGYGRIWHCDVRLFGAGAETAFSGGAGTLLFFDFDTPL